MIRAFVLTYSNKGGADKTTAAVSIARILAECGVKTALCDFDLRSRPLDPVFPEGVWATASRCRYPV